MGPHRMFGIKSQQWKWKKYIFMSNFRSEFGNKLICNRKEMTAGSTGIEIKVMNAANNFKILFQIVHDTSLP